MRQNRVDSMMSQKMMQMQKKVFNGLSALTVIFNTNSLYKLLQNLVYLDMSQNKLKDLAGLHFVEFKHLKTLKLNYNFLQKLDYISHLTMLQELEVSNNKIRSINP